MSFALKKATSPFHKRAVLILIVVCIVSFALVGYLALSRATIIVEAKSEPISAELLATVKEIALNEADIAGKIGFVEVSKEESFSSSASDKQVPGIAEGGIVIYNNSTKNQELIKTTRFLSKEGVLFRLKKAVVVLAGKSVEAVVYADKEGESGDIAPTTFTIPGLSLDLQKKIYGESKEKMTGGIKNISVLTQQAIDNATEELRAPLLEEARKQLTESLNKDNIFAGIAIKDEMKERTCDTEIGESVDNFKVKLVLKVIGVAYSKDLENQANITLIGILPSSRKIISSNVAELKPTIENYDLTGKVANLKATVSGEALLSGNDVSLDKEKLVGLSEAEALDILQKYPGVESVSIDFFPFFLKQMPRLRDHIKIVVK